MGFFESLPKLKDDLRMNLDVASPANFIPELPAWRDRSLFIARHGRIDFHHTISTARRSPGFFAITSAMERELLGMLDARLNEPARLRELSESIKPQLIR